MPYQRRVGTWGTVGQSGGVGSRTVLPGARWRPWPRPGLRRVDGRMGRPGGPLRGASMRPAPLSECRGPGNRSAGSPALRAEAPGAPFGATPPPSAGRPAAGRIFFPLARPRPPRPRPPLGGCPSLRGDALAWWVAARPSGRGGRGRRVSSERVAVAGQAVRVRVTTAGRPWPPELGWVWWRGGRVSPKARRPGHSPLSRGGGCARRRFHPKCPGPGHGDPDRWGPAWGRAPDPPEP